MVARGELPPDLTARLTVASRTASPRAASTFSPVRPQVACAGALNSCPRRPASTEIPRFSASSVRLAASTTGRPRSRQARASGRCRARLPASATTRIASGAASRRYIQNGSSPAGSSSRDRVPGRSTSHASRPPTVTRRRSRPTVVPGALAVSTKRRLALARKVDLPTLGRPTMATTGRRSVPSPGPVPVGPEWQTGRVTRPARPMPRGDASAPAPRSWSRVPGGPVRAPRRGGRRVACGRRPRQRCRRGCPRARAPIDPDRRCG